MSVNIEDSILNKINEYSFNLLNVPECFNTQVCDYTLPKSLRIAINFNTMGGVFDVDIEPAMLSHIGDEFTSSINKDVIKEMALTNNIHFIDKRGIGDVTMLPFTSVRDVTDEISKHSIGYENLICNSAVACLLQDDSRFYITPSSSPNKISGSLLYEVGKFGGIRVWVDPYARFTDYRMLFFNNVDVKLSGFSTNLVNEATFHPRLLIGFNILILNNGVKRVHLITNESGSDWSEFIQYNRDLKINEILDEKEK